MMWIMFTVSFLVCSIVAVFLISCLAIAQQADEQSEKAYSVLAGKSTVQQNFIQGKTFPSALYGLFLSNP